MNAKSLLRSLKTEVDRDSQLFDRLVDVKIEGSSQVAEAIVRVEVEGKWKRIRVFAEDLGFEEIAPAIRHLRIV